MSEILDAFQKMSKNLMTPNVLSVEEKEGFVFELSSGRGMEEEPIFGATISEYAPSGKPHPFTPSPYSRMFRDKANAKEYLSQMKKCVKNERLQLGCVTDTLADFKDRKIIEE